MSDNEKRVVNAPKNNEAPVITEEPVLKRKHLSNIPLILMMFIMIVFGLVILYSVSGPAGYATAEKSTVFYLKKQLAYTVVGIVIAIVLNFMPIWFFKKKAIWTTLFASSIGIIVLTAVAGVSINGAKRWIGTKSVTFQTSEFVKVALVVALAGYWTWLKTFKTSKKYRHVDNKFRQLFIDAMFDFIIPVGFSILVDVLILMQPHLSCAIIVAFIVFMCTLTAGINWKSWVIGGGMLAIVGILGIGVLFLAMPDKMQGYIESNFAHVVKRTEIYSATHDEDSQTQLSEDDTRQVTNAHNALGSGGLWGRGIGNSRAKYNYVSEAQNDYIFSIYVEETGFMGGTILILLYMILIGMCVGVIIRTDSAFSRVVAVGCTSLIMIEFLLNIAVELQVIPSTGVTLPFVSYGGTAQVFLLGAYGMILCVSRTGTKPATKKEQIDGV